MSLSCTSCGACCTNPDPKWVEVTNSDAEHISPDMLQQGDILPYAMKMTDGICCALEGILGAEVRCSIYPNRPTICRVVQIGDHICNQSRTGLEGSQSGSNAL